MTQSEIYEFTLLFIKCQEWCKGETVIPEPRVSRKNDHNDSDMVKTACHVVM